MKLSKNQHVLLNLISDRFDSHLKLEKTVYLVQSITGLFSYSFYRGDYGPVSYEFNMDLNFLIQSELIYSYFGYREGTSVKIYKVSNKGKKYLKSKLRVLNIVFNKRSKNQILKCIYNSSNQRNLEIGDFFPLTNKNYLRNYFSILEFGGIEELGKTTT